MVEILYKIEIILPTDILSVYFECKYKSEYGNIEIFSCCNMCMFFSCTYTLFNDTWEINILSIRKSVIIFIVFFLHVVILFRCLFTSQIAQNIAERCQKYFLYFIATLQFQLSEIFSKTNRYLILLEILYKYFVKMCRSYTFQEYFQMSRMMRKQNFFSTLYF